MENRGLDKLTTQITELVLAELKEMGVTTTGKNLFTVPVSVSGRHLHLSSGDLEQLFGVGFQLSRQKNISQPGQYASNEKVTLVGAKGQIENLRVLGPLRPETQVELAASDARRIGLKLPVRASGDFTGTPGARLVGPKGQVMLNKGCMIAERHIHMTPEQARERNLGNGQEVQVRVGGDKGGVLGKVFVHVREDFAYDMHVDADDANAFMLGSPCYGEILTTD